MLKQKKMIPLHISSFNPTLIQEPGHSLVIYKSFLA